MNQKSDHQKRLEGKLVYFNIRISVEILFFENLALSYNYAIDTTELLEICNPKKNHRFTGGSLNLFVYCMTMVC